MAFYKFTAKDKSNKRIKGVIEAPTKMDARKQLRAKGFKQIENLSVSKDAAKDNRLRRLSLKDKIDFTQTFQTLHRAGVPIIESLLFLGNEASSVSIRNISNAIRQEILEGATFAGTIAKYTNIFDKIYIGLVKAGEDSGEMDKTLGRLAELLNKQASINTRVFGAMLYPVFVVVLAVVIFVVMVVFVFPKFAEAFSSTGKALPPITQFCIDLGNNIKGFWYLYIIGVVGFVFLCIQLPKWPSSRKILDRWALKIPVINDLVVKSNFSNYLSVLLVAYNAGIPIVDSLYLSTLTLTNVVLKEALEGVSKKVQQGAQMSGAMKSSGVVPKMVTFMVSTGEQSGRLGELLENAVSFIDQELDKAIDVMTKMMEPLLIVVIGVIVLFLALALYLPLFGMADV